MKASSKVLLAISELDKKSNAAELRRSDREGMERRIAELVELPRMTSLRSPDLGGLLTGRRAVVPPGVLLTCCLCVFPEQLKVSDVWSDHWNGTVSEPHNRRP